MENNLKSDINHNIIKQYRNKYTDKPGTCFAGFGKVCSDTLIPNVKKAEKLRTQKYW